MEQVSEQSSMRMRTVLSLNVVSPCVRYYFCDPSCHIGAIPASHEKYRQRSWSFISQTVVRDLAKRLVKMDGPLVKQERAGERGRWEDVKLLRKPCPATTLASHGRSEASENAILEIVDRSKDFLVLGKPKCLELREDTIPIDRHFERPAVTFD